jgi:ubiquinone/menaquinone biosynthesis C-methylase UbiE
MGDFYGDTAVQLGIAASDSVLVVCGGPYDKAVLARCGVVDGVISNVDYHDGVQDYAPYRWRSEDAENLTAADQSVDWAFVHNGLHHCGSPHRAFCEMLRVARKGVLVIEARDSLLMRTANRFGLSPNFEMEPILLSDGRDGGLRNGPIPNYIYRWTEREIKKTVASFLPHQDNTIRFFYGYRLPLQRIAMSRSPLKRGVVGLAAAGGRVLEAVAPRQGNLFGVAVFKTGALQPWIKQTASGPAPDMAYINRVYDASKYKKT